MRNLIAFASMLALAAPPQSQDPLVRSAQRKLDEIRSGKPKPGAVYSFSVAELNAWGRDAAKELVPEGIRDPRLTLGQGTASVFMYIDFLKVRKGKKLETGWLLSRLLEGERPLRVRATITSSKGHATVHLTLVSISGIPISGSSLDFLVDTFLRPLFPDAKINQPFELHDNVDHIEVLPAAARVLIKR